MIRNCNADVPWELTHLRCMCTLCNSSAPACVGTRKDKGPCGNALSRCSTLFFEIGFLLDLEFNWLGNLQDQLFSISPEVVLQANTTHLLWALGSYRQVFRLGQQVLLVTAFPWSQKSVLEIVLSAEICNTISWMATLTSRFLPNSDVGKFKLLFKKLGSLAWWHIKRKNRWTFIITELHYKFYRPGDLPLFLRPSM